MGARLGLAHEEVKSHCFPEAALRIPLPGDGSLEGRGSVSIYITLGRRETHGSKIATA